MKANIVSSGFFGSSQFSRLDAEYADPDLVSVEDDLKKHNQTTTVGGVGLDVDTTPVLSDHFDDDTVVNYIAIDNVDTDDGLLLPQKIEFSTRPSRAKHLLKTNDVLVSNVRPNRGAIAHVPPWLSGAVASSGFTVLRLSEEANDELSSYLFAFLRSCLGRLQLVRRNRGSMYPAVLAQDVLNVCIPNPSASLLGKIHKGVMAGRKHQEAFFTRHNSSQAVLEDWLSQICAPPPSPLSNDSSDPSVSIRSSGEFFSVNGARRFDAEFFRQEYADFQNELCKQITCTQLGAEVTLESGRAQGPPNQSISYMKQGALTNYGINWSAVHELEGSVTPERGHVKSKDVVLACTAHEVFYVGRKVDFVRSVPKSQAGSTVAVADLLILRPKADAPFKLPGSYVAGFLRSPWGLHQVQRCIRGLRGGHVYADDLAKYVTVPIPEKEWLKEYENLTSEAEEKRNLAKKSIGTAINTLESALWTGPLPAIPEYVT